MCLCVCFITRVNERTHGTGVTPSRICNLAKAAFIRFYVPRNMVLKHGFETRF